MVLRLGMDWADAKRHIAKEIAIRIANRHEGTAPECFLCRVCLAFSFIEKISKHPFNFIMGRKSKYVHFMCGRFPASEPPAVVKAKRKSGSIDPN